jgi:hypothetical protein
MNKSFYNFRNSSINEGYIALLSVIVISVLGIAIMLSVVSSGVNAIKTDFSLQQLGNARSMASSCAEEALQRILDTSITSGSGNLAIASGTCTYTVTSTNGQNITVSSTGSFGTITSKIKVVIATTSPSIILSSWEEVSDF